MKSAVARSMEKLIHASPDKGWQKPHVGPPAGCVGMDNSPTSTHQIERYCPRNSSRSSPRKNLGLIRRSLWECATCRTCIWRALRIPRRLIGLMTMSATCLPLTCTPSHSTLRAAKKVYSHGAIRLLMLRLENLDHCVTDPFREFLGLETFCLSREIQAQSKVYASEYREFMKTLSLPSLLVSKMHNTRYARHSYSPDELNASIRQWKKSARESS
jgi:Putative capsular polysaccharide synthesis protein